MFPYENIKLRAYTYNLYGADSMITHSHDLLKENLFSTVRMLGRNPGGALLELPSGTVAGASGLPYAGENYALFSSSAGRDDMLSVLDFFKIRNIPFIVPQNPDLNGTIKILLASQGFKAYHTYTSMSINTSVNNGCDPDVIEVSCPLQAAEWADSTWAGFTEEQNAPDKFSNLAEYMYNSNDNILFYLKFEGKPVCTGLIHQSQNTCGLYYFATHALFRRRGFAYRLMRHIVWRISLITEKIVLLATESGYPMYLNFGFAAEKQIQILSLSDDI